MAKLMANLLIRAIRRYQFSHCKNNSKKHIIQEIEGLDLLLNNVEAILEYLVFHSGTAGRAPASSVSCDVNHLISTSHVTPFKINQFTFMMSSMYIIPSFLRPFCLRMYFFYRYPQSPSL